MLQRSRKRNINSNVSSFGEQVTPKPRTFYYVIQLVLRRKQLAPVIYGLRNGVVYSTADSERVLEYGVYLNLFIPKRVVYTTNCAHQNSWRTPKKVVCTILGIHQNSWRTPKKVVCTISGVRNNFWCTPPLMVYT